MSKKIKLFTPYINESLSYHKALNEMARIDTPSKDQLPGNIKIYVYGENDESGTKTPHFHVIGEKFEFEVYIEHIKELNIWRTKRIDKKSNTNTWAGRTNIKDAIQEWLDKSNARFTGMTNAEVIVNLWNMSNSNNEIEQDFKN